MTEMNILLTSVGRRAYMVKFFQEALHGSGCVHACNSDDLTVAFQYADYHAVTPLIYDEEYIPFLLRYCAEHHIDMLLSLFDADLPVLARNKNRFETIGTRVIVSDPDIVDICNDKWKAYQYLSGHGFRVPRSYLDVESVYSAIERGEISYPIMVKPRFGCGSISVMIAENEEEIRYCHNKAVKTIRASYLKYESAASEQIVIFQELLRGQEYGVDIINDLQGNYCNSIIKKKIAMRAGETDIAELVDDEDIRKETERLAALTGHIGNMDCDLFMIDGTPYILELNARFGGGYPFSHMAGCDLPAALLRWARGGSVPQKMLIAKTGGRYYKELIITKEKDFRQNNFLGEV